MRGRCKCGRKRGWDVESLEEPFTFRAAKSIDSGVVVQVGLFGGLFLESVHIAILHNICI